MANENKPTQPAEAADGAQAVRDADDLKQAEAERQREIGLLEQIRTELDEAKDRALRSQAELENYRKRVAREMEDQRRYAALPLIRDLLPVLDNVQRTIEAAEKTHDTAALLDGVKLIGRLFETVLERHHAVRIAALGQPFDPHKHEAILQQPSAEHPANTVMQVTQGGFQLHDRIVRPSQVIVSAGDGKTTGE